MSIRDAFAARLDSWVNVALGFGGVSDKIKATRYSGQVNRLTPGELTAMYRTEHLSAKIVDVYPREAYREGFEVAGYEAEKNTPEGEDDTEEKVATYLRAWNVVNVCLLASIWARLYGGACVWLGSFTADPGVPFALGERIDFLRVIDRRYLQARPWSLDALGHPQFYDVIPHEGAGMVGPVHASRLVMFGGALTDAQSHQANGYWDDTVLQRPYDALKSDGIVWRSAEQLISEASLGVLMIKGLYAKISGPARQQIEDRLSLFNLTRSIARNMTLDKDNEEYRRESVTFAGVSDLTSESVKRVASAAEIPVSILLSDEPSGLNATGDASIRWWLMRVHAYRTGQLEKPTLYLVRVILAQSGIAAVSADKSEKLAIKWPPLWTPSAKEQSEIYASTSTADCAYIDRGVVDANEIALSRFGKDGYSQDTNIDRRLREPPDEEALALAAAEADGATGAPAPAAKPGEGPAGENVQAQVLNGTQVASLVDVVAKVAGEEIPRDAGVEIIMLAYQVDKPKAELLMGSAGTAAFKPKEDPAPAPFGGGGGSFGSGGGDKDEDKGAPFGKATSPKGKAPPPAPAADKGGKAGPQGQDPQRGE